MCSLNARGVVLKWSLWCGGFEWLPFGAVAPRCLGLMHFSKRKACSCAASQMMSKPRCEVTLMIRRATYHWNKEEQIHSAKLKVQLSEIFSSLSFWPTVESSSIPTSTNWLSVSTFSGKNPKWHSDVVVITRQWLVHQWMDQLMQQTFSSICSGIHFFLARFTSKQEQTLVIADAEDENEPKRRNRDIWGH